MATASNGDLLAAFRRKANFMKSWKPSSTPSNRDRLELYAWHKQAVSGDAPASIASLTAAEKAKYLAWKSKAGVDATTAMRNYITESERQVRVYGMNQPAALPQNPSSSNTTTTPPMSRGLAAIPLLCAAASEQRVAYLRRLANTNAANAWWRRQEPLTATPGTIAAIPESILLFLAGLVEGVSLNTNTKFASTIQSALWPLHNCFLGLWMGLILIASIWSSGFELAKTILLGGRRTGRTIDSIWHDEVVFASHSVHTLTESHQPLVAKCIGLMLQPLPLAVGALGIIQNSLYASAAYVVGIAVTWWYWSMVLPWVFCVVVLGTAVGLGGCFGMIELATIL